MNIRYYSRLVFVGVLLLGFSTTFAQKVQHKKSNVSGPEVVWKKEVYRVVDLSQKDGANIDRSRDVNGDKTLIELLENDIKDGALSAYTNSEMRVLDKLSEKAIKKVFGTTPDTAIVQDAESGKYSTKITQKEFNYDLEHKYKVLEEWSCHPETGTTEIQIMAICPLKDIVAHDGTVRGEQPLFWVRYGNITGILTTYEEYQPYNTISGRSWDDFFQSEGKTGATK